MVLEFSFHGFQILRQKNTKRKAWHHKVAHSWNLGSRGLVENTSRRQTQNHAPRDPPLCGAHLLLPMEISWFFNWWLWSMVETYGALSYKKYILHWKTHFDPSNYTVLSSNTLVWSLLLPFEAVQELLFPGYL